ncbi:MAG TPA: CoA-transferase [Burkholderiales bacterium]|nr:CoA-transferase [Burkholderiales bacterium]
MNTTKTEVLVATIARLLEGCRSVVIGNQSPIPGTAALVARELAGGAMRVTILGSRRHTDFTSGGVETFDRAAQGRVDVFFLGGGQIDGEANINLVGAGDYPRVDVRWPGSFGSAYLYFLVPRVILFREEHTSRVFVKKVDFVSAPGTSPLGVYRPGGPWKLVTGLGQFAFDRSRKRFALESVHPGHTVEEIVASTGFEFDRAASVPATPAPEPHVLALIRGRIRDEIAETYPKFAGTLLASP